MQEKAQEYSIVLVAHLFNCPYQRMHDEVLAGRIEGHRIGGKWRIPRYAVDAYHRQVRGSPLPKSWPPVASGEAIPVKQSTPDLTERGESHATSGGGAE